MFIESKDREVMGLENETLNSEGERRKKLH